MLPFIHRFATMSRRAAFVAQHRAKGRREGMARRAANGESSIHQGADGRWHGYVTVRPAARSSGAPAPRVRGDPRRDGHQGPRPGTQTRQRADRHRGHTATVSEWLDHWLTNIAAHRERRRSRESTAPPSGFTCPPVSAGTAWTGCSPNTSSSSTAPCSPKALPTTVLRAQRILSRALQIAVQRGRIARNVATLVDLPAARHTDTRTGRADR